MKKAQFHELVGHLVREVLNELDNPMDSTLSTTTDSIGAGSVSAMSPVMQQKLEREKKKAAQQKLKTDQRMLKKVTNDEKSLKTSYDMTRRITKPNLKKQIDAQKKSIALGI